MKLPLPRSPDVLRSTDPPAIAAGPAVLWRVRRTTSLHSYGWKELRRFGPLRSARFDPHQPPAREQDEQVGYFGADWLVCLAEAFHVTRVVDTVTGAPFITGFQPTRTLHLLDLRGQWPLRIGASHHVNTGRKDYCRAWARALRLSWPDADGLLSVGINAGPVITLFRPAGDVFPDAPRLDRPLSDPALDTRVHTAADIINYRVR